MGKTDENSQKAKFYNVIIVGGGISGLQAASELAKKRMEDFVLLEGSDRLGGRIKTLTVGPTNAIVEMGANWVQAVEENPVFKLARDNDLMPIDLKARGLEKKVLFATESGEPIHPRVVSEVDLLFGQLMSECESFYRDQMPTPYEDDSVGAFIEREFEDRISCHQEENKEVRRMVLAQRLIGESLITGAASMRDVSLSEAGCFEDLPGRHSVIPEGFESVIGLLERSIPPGNILRNSVVSSICWDSGDQEYPVKVLTTNGCAFHAKTCLVTSSLGYLKKHHPRLFMPPLPRPKVESIQSLAMGVVNKLVLFFDAPLFVNGITRLEMIWHRNEGEETDVASHWFKKIPSIDAITSDIGICWLSGREAEYVETLTQAQVCNTMGEVLKGFLSRLAVKVPKVTKVLSSNWKSHPLILGSYIHIPVGTPATAINDLAEPVRNSKNQTVLFFAGEATHPTFYTSSHGAMLSGLREANNILSHLPPSAQGTNTSQPSTNGSHE